MSAALRPWYCTKCKRCLGTIAWFERHTAHCEGGVSAQLVLLMQATIRNFAPRLAATVVQDNALLRALIRNRKGT